MISKIQNHLMQSFKKGDEKSMKNNDPEDSNHMPKEDVIDNDVYDLIEEEMLEESNRINILV